MAGRQPHHLRPSHILDTGTGRATDGTRGSRGLFRPSRCGRNRGPPAPGARRVGALEGRGGGWGGKVSVAGRVKAGTPGGPEVPSLRELACRDFKIADTPPELPWGLSLAGGLERLVHDLRNVRIGVALGGGAA